MPQVEVTFDIDVNGIVHVTAKDKGTGKENTIKIQEGSGLSQEEIDRMIKDAEAHAEEDRKRREEADVRNQAESLVYQTEKFVKEQREAEGGSKVPEDTLTKVDAAVAEAKTGARGQRHQRDQVRDGEAGRRVPGARPGDLRGHPGRAARWRRTVAPAAPTTTSWTPRWSTRRAGEQVTQSDPHEPVTFTDKRRIDPVTGEVREAAGPAPSGPAPEAPEPADTE